MSDGARAVWTAMVVVIVGLAIVSPSLLGSTPRPLEGQVTAAVARPTWSSFCAQLSTIRAANEAPPSLPDPSHGLNGVARLRRQYTQLVGLSPTKQVVGLLRAAQAILIPRRDGTRAVKVTTMQRRAIQRLDPMLSAHCGDTTGNVFKVVVS